jgi:DNL zinc finger
MRPPVSFPARNLATAASHVRVVSRGRRILLPAVLRRSSLERPYTSTVSAATASAISAHHHHHLHRYNANSGIRAALHSSSSSDTNERTSPRDDTADENDTIEIIVSLPTDHTETDNATTRLNDTAASSSSLLNIPGAQKGGRKLALVYTCTVCDTRSVQQFTERAYRHGVVIVRCPKCRRQHLIADHLGYFDDEQNAPFDLAAAAAAKGHSMVVHNDASQLIRLEDLVGRDQLQQILDTTAQRKADAANTDATNTPKT